MSYGWDSGIESAIPNSQKGAPGNRHRPSYRSRALRQIANILHLCIVKSRRGMLFKAIRVGMQEVTASSRPLKIPCQIIRLVAVQVIDFRHSVWIWNMSQRHQPVNVHALPVPSIIQVNKEIATSTKVQCLYMKGPAVPNAPKGRDFIGLLPAVHWKPEFRKGNLFLHLRIILSGVIGQDVSASLPFYFTTAGCP